MVVGGLTLVDVAGIAPLAFLLGVVVGLAAASRYRIVRKNGER